RQLGEGCGVATVERAAQRRQQAFARIGPAMLKPADRRKNVRALVPGDFRLARGRTGPGARERIELAPLLGPQRGGDQDIRQGGFVLRCDVHFEAPFGEVARDVRTRRAAARRWLVPSRANVALGPKAANWTL